MYTIFCIYSKIINHIYTWGGHHAKKAEIFHKWREGGQTKASEAEERIKEVHFQTLKESCALLYLYLFSWYLDWLRRRWIGAPWREVEGRGWHLAVHPRPFNFLIIECFQQAESLTLCWRWGRRVPFEIQICWDLWSLGPCWGNIFHLTWACQVVIVIVHIFMVGKGTVQHESKSALRPTYLTWGRGISLRRLIWDLCRLIKATEAHLKSYCR